MAEQKLTFIIDAQNRSAKALKDVGQGVDEVQTVD